MVKMRKVNYEKITNASGSWRWISTRLIQEIQSPWRIFKRLVPIYFPNLVENVRPHKLGTQWTETKL